MFFSHIKLFYLLIFILLQACTSSGVAPVSNRDEIKEPPPNITKPGKETKKNKQKRITKKQYASTRNKLGCHAITQGDTLYSIAWRYNYDYRELANWNNIDSPYIIHLGKKICFKPIQNKQTKEKKSQSKDAKFSKKKNIEKKPEIKNDSVVKKERQSKNPSSGAVKWFWPTKGKLVRLNSPTSKKGIDISGIHGQSVNAAATGEIVYSGSGLVGYGKLIIIKHNDKFLSAYAYNSKILVKEGDTVKAGQEISKMGQDHAGRKILHFEIRHNGKPINPLKHLPKNR
tara:strand:+ start:1688 stop:2545 length:858 start_codon:yes stop_codon:yes gene_type:complete